MSPRGRREIRRSSASSAASHFLSKRLTSGFGVTALSPARAGADRVGVSMASGADIVVATSIPPRLSRTNDGVSVGDEYQRLCVESWFACGFKVLSVNPREEIEPLARRFPEIEFVPVDSDAR